MMVLLKESIMDALMEKKMCDAHQSTLGCNWRGPPVKRVPAPVPCYKGDRPGFHYTNPDLFSDATEKERKIDDLP